MSFRVIKPGTQPTTIPCNICDEECQKSAYEGTKTGICDVCRATRTDADMASIYYILSIIHDSHNKRKRGFDWYRIREVIKTLYIMIEDKNFSNNVGTYLTRLGLLRDEIFLCVDTYLKLKQRSV